MTISAATNGQNLNRRLLVRWCPRPCRAFFEPRFGHDFSQVRVYADARAARLAQAMQARAFTLGRDVVFGAGQYAPGTPAGQRLLAHELTHVVQQGAAREQPGAAMSPTVSERCSDRIPGSFLGDLWEGVKSVGRTVGGALAGAAKWVGGLSREQPSGSCERVGSLYLGQAIHAQATIGYGYGGTAGLHSDRAAGKHYRDYNREQQAQIAQDYYTLLSSGGATTDYDPFIAELRAGAL